MADPIVTAMQEVAGPHLYRRNAFRITGLRTDADRPAVRHQRQRIGTLLKVGGDTGLDVDPQEATAAFDLILGDPRRRLVHELFWMWDQPGATCTCSAALHRAHDSAVRAHSEALDAELDSKWPSPLERRRLDELWSKAGNVWHQQARRAAFWNHLRERIVALDDRQLSESVIDTLRDELPVTLVRPLVQLTVAGGKRQAELSKLALAWPGTSTFVETQLEKAAEPLYEELRTELREIAEGLTGATTPQEAAKRLRAKATPKLDQLEALVPAARHRQTARLRNDVATALNNIAIKLIDSTGAAAEKTAGDWLKQARELANEPQTIATIDKNAATLAEIVRAARTPALLRQTRGGNASVEDILRAYNGLRPADPYRPRFAFVRKLLKLAVWALILYGIYWVIFTWRPDLGSSDNGRKVSVAAQKISDNAPVSTCIAGEQDWVSKARALTSVACDQEHWGEVLGYLPLGDPSAYPGDELLSQRSLYGCAFLQAQRGAATGEYLVDSLYTSQADWNKGDNYATCLLHRADNKAMPRRTVADTSRTAAPDLSISLTMMSLNLATNPPPGSCIATKSSYDKNDARADFIDCAQPHWGEIIGYPVLYEPGGTWPGDPDVYATADPACRALHQKRAPGKEYTYVTAWPGQQFWTASPNTRKYAVCIVKRTDDKPTTGALK
jgi:hypothetical protein